MQIIVLKFGSSVLRTPADLPRAVDEIYRYVRDGQRVVAVVSAFAGETDRLFAEAERHAQRGCDYAVAALVATGEQHSAARLCLALDESGIPARVVLPSEIHMRSAGDPRDSEPESLDHDALLSRIRHHPVTVIPGFFAVDDENRTVLLGRGGTDLTAVFIAHHLGADCRLIKDVDGIYVRDPALPGPRPPRYSIVSWDEALRVGGELVQRKAIRWAKAHGLGFTVAAVGSASGTRVVNGSSQISLNGSVYAFPGHRNALPLRVSLLGLGTVGRGVYERLSVYPEHFIVTSILVRDAGKHVAQGIPVDLLIEKPSDALLADADLIVDALPASKLALSLTLAALDSRRSVVTANKGNVASHLRRFSAYAQRNRPQLRMSAAVGGSVPILETVESLKQTAGIVRVRGVMNGTCNFMLERMQGGCSYADALAEAQKSGFAEPDPRLDVSGQDAASKLLLISLKAFARVPTAVECEGIDQLQNRSVSDACPPDGVLKLVGELDQRNALPQGRVALQVLPPDDFLAGARFEENRFEILLENGQTVQLRGRGAGRWPTATAVMGDIWSIAREFAR